MLKVDVNLSRHMPIQREMAMKITAVSDKYLSTLTLEHKGIVLNLKSMIGLLSQSIPKDGQMVLVADGTDEKAALEAVLAIINE